MNINNGDIPKSTLVVAGALYTILVGLVTWNLAATISIKDKQAQDIQGVRLDLAATQGHVAVLESRMDSYEGNK